MVEFCTAALTRSKGFFGGCAWATCSCAPASTTASICQAWPLAKGMAVVPAAIDDLVMSAQARSQAMGADHFEQFSIGRRQSDELGRPVLWCDISRWFRQAGDCGGSFSSAFGHGHLLHWIAARFSLSLSSAQNFMNVADSMGTNSQSLGI